MRIDASTNQEVIRSVAFKNTDNSIAVVLFNDSEKAENVALNLPGADELSFRLASKSALSILIK